MTAVCKSACSSPSSAPKSQDRRACSTYPTAASRRCAGADGACGRSHVHQEASPLRSRRCCSCPWGQLSATGREGFWPWRAARSENRAPPLDRLTAMMMTTIMKTRKKGIIVTRNPKAVAAMRKKKRKKMKKKKKKEEEKKMIMRMMTMMMIVMKTENTHAVHAPKVMNQQKARRGGGDNSALIRSGMKKRWKEIEGIDLLESLYLTS
mmetsp:Transcript_27582/g.44896  ORF Transcript_27582/g.44896 Transcript_27582/m.44896 type:complete len:208 (+) Transcript_27582:1464-2087(+)